MNNKHICAVIFFFFLVKETPLLPDILVWDESEFVFTLSWEVW